jgi:hypothetical protein
MLVQGGRHIGLGALEDGQHPVLTGLPGLPVRIGSGHVPFSTGAPEASVCSVTGQWVMKGSPSRTLTSVAKDAQR